MQTSETRSCHCLWVCKAHLVGQRVVGSNHLYIPEMHQAFSCGTVVLVDEHMMSQECHRCDQITCPVMNDGHKIRGLRWRRSTNCRTFLNRDRNAVLNIARCLRCGTLRPQGLMRIHGEQTGEAPRPPAVFLTSACKGSATPPLRGGFSHLLGLPNNRMDIQIHIFGQKTSCQFQLPPFSADAPSIFVWYWLMNTTGASTYRSP